MVMVRHWRQRFLRPGRGHAALVVLASLACGCKTGSWGAKPSWWSFGGTAPAGSALTAAPTFDQDPVKPSEAAKPYPTTTTPESYALDGSTKTAAGVPAASATVEPAAVTYGTTVAARTEPPAATYPTTEPPAATYPTTEPAAANAAVATQVGPYASLQQPASSPPAASDPAAAAMAGFGAAPGFETERPPAAQAGVPGMPPAGTRVADARGGAGWPAASPAAIAAPPDADSFGSQDSRYENAGSRFSGGGSFQPAAEPAFQPVAAPTAADPTLDQFPATQPSSPPASPATSLPGALPPPTRRPDPGYRPGGTASYRPNRAILAEDDAVGGSVQPVAYELPASPN